jgi:hypothetical protein
MVNPTLNEIFEAPVGTKFISVGKTWTIISKIVDEKNEKTKILLTPLDKNPGFNYWILYYETGKQQVKLTPPCISTMFAEANNVITFGTLIQKLKYYHMNTIAGMKELEV